MAVVKKSKAEIPTIDCNLITIEVDGSEFGFETASKIGVEPQVEETDAIKLVIKGKLKAQKPKQITVTGNEITLTDNVFNPELVLVLRVFLALVPGPVLVLVLRSVLSAHSYFITRISGSRTVLTTSTI